MVRKTEGFTGRESYWKDRERKKKTEEHRRWCGKEWVFGLWEDKFMGC